MNLARKSEIRIRFLSLPVFVWCVVALNALPADAAGLPAGDIVVSAKISDTDAGLIEIDPTTGNRRIISDNTHGTGMPFTTPVGVSLLPNDELLVADAGFPDLVVGPPEYVPPPPSPARIYVVDPTTGNRTVLSQDAIASVNPPYPQVGTGPAFGQAALARQIGDRIIVDAMDADTWAGQVMSVDPATGNRSVISNSSVGAGFGLSWPNGFVVSGNTAFLATEFAGLLTVDLTTGNRILLSGATAGAGPTFHTGIDLQPFGGQLYVSGAGNMSTPSTYGVFRIDPVTGNRSVVTNETVGSGPFGNDATLALAIEPGGTILVTVGPDSTNNFSGLLTVDPLTGNRAFLSDATHGSGASFAQMYCVAVVPLSGDANGDGIVNAQDLATISSQWNHSGPFLPGDLNNDGIVNGQDLALASSGWLQTALGHAAAGTGAAAAVPEPAAVVLLLLAIVSLVIGRGRYFS